MLDSNEKLSFWVYIFYIFLNKIIFCYDIRDKGKYDDLEIICLKILVIFKFV